MYLSSNLSDDFPLFDENPVELQSGVSVLSYCHGSDLFAVATDDLEINVYDANRKAHVRRCAIFLVKHVAKF